MLTGLLHTHSMLRYIVVLLAIVLIISAIIGLLSKKPSAIFSLKLAKYLVILTHIQLLLGFSLYLSLNYHNLLKDMANTMSNADLRWKAIEHLVTMLFAVVLITLGNARAKRAITSQKVFSNHLIFIGIALILIFLGIPTDRWF